MREIECRKGFTLVELLIVLAILAILGALFIPMIDGKAHGAELGQFLLAEDDTMAEVAHAAQSDPHQTLTILVYAKTWDVEKVDTLLDKAAAVQAKLISHRIPVHRINLHLANEGGLKEDGTTAPASDGVYISLD